MDAKGIIMLSVFIGTMSFDKVNSERNTINKELEGTLRIEAGNWGVEIVRTELKEIEPPKDVQEVMNNVLKAQKEKEAAINIATARETEADGFRRAEIKKADGDAQAIILRATANANAVKLAGEAEAKRIEMVSRSAEDNFKDRAALQKKLEVLESSLKDNVKWFIPQGTDLTLLLNESNAPIVPVNKKNKVD